MLCARVLRRRDCRTGGTFSFVSLLAWVQARCSLYDHWQRSWLFTALTAGGGGIAFTELLVLLVDF